MSKKELNEDLIEVKMLLKKNKRELDEVMNQSNSVRLETEKGNKKLEKLQKDIKTSQKVLETVSNKVKNSKKAVNPIAIDIKAHKNELQVVKNEIKEAEKEVIVLNKQGDSIIKSAEAEARRVVANADSEAQKHFDSYDKVKGDVVIQEARFVSLKDKNNTLAGHVENKEVTLAKISKSVDLNKAELDKTAKERQVSEHKLLDYKQKCKIAQQDIARYTTGNGVLEDNKVKLEKEVATITKKIEAKNNEFEDSTQKILAIADREQAVAQREVYAKAKFKKAGLQY